MVKLDDNRAGDDSSDTEPAGQLLGSDAPPQSQIEERSPPKTPVAAQEESDLNKFGAWQREAVPFTVIHEPGQLPAELGEVRDMLRSLRASVAGWVRQRGPQDREILGRRPQFYARNRTGTEAG